LGARWKPSVMALLLSLWDMQGMYGKDGKDGKDVLPSFPGASDYATTVAAGVTADSFFSPVLMR
jgi:hypothetical protein